MNSNAEQTQEPPASEPRSVPPDGAGRRRSCRKAVVFFALCALLLAGGFAWHVRRAEARRSELVRLVSGPLLPGTADVEYTWHWFWGTVSPRPRWFFNIRALSRRELGADLVRRRISRFEDGDDQDDGWIVAAGSPAEKRLFDFLRADPFVENVRTCPRPFRGGNYVSWHELDTLFPTNTSDWVAEPSDTETFAFRDRLTGFFEAESVRPDVAFREERQTFFLSCVCVPRHKPGWFRRAVGWVCGKLDAAPLAPLSEWAERGPGGTDDPLFRISWTTIEIWDGVPAPGFRVGKNASGFPRTFVVPDGTPLAAAIRNLCAKRRPWTFGTPFSRANPLPPDREFSATLTGWNGEEEWAVSSESPTPRFRAFVTDLLRLLADPPSATPSPAAEETHAESAETAESGSPAGGAGERSETEGVSHAETAETAEP